MKIAIFGQFDNFRSDLFTEIVKRHIYGPRPSILANNQVYMTFHSKVLVRISSCLEQPQFLAILANFTTSGRVILTEMVERHIYGPRPFIWAFNQVSMTFRSKVLARTCSSLEKPLFLVIWANFTTFGQKALLRTKTFHLSLYPSLYDRPFKSASPYKKAMTNRQTDEHPTL